MFANNGNLINLAYIFIIILTIWLKLNDRLTEGNKKILLFLFIGTSLYYFLTVFGSNDNKEHLNNSTVESRIENPNGRIFNVLVNVDGTATTNLTLKNGDDSGIIDLIDMYDTIKFINDNEKPQLFKIMRHEYVCPVRDIVPHRSNQRFEVNSNKDCKVYSSIEFYRVLAPKTYTTYRILVRSGTVYYPGRKNNITTTYELVKPQSLLVDVN